MRRLFPDNTFVKPKFPLPGHDLKRLAIAEAPGQEESLTGVPLSGGAGKWFESMLRQAGIDKDGVTKLNCIQCRPPENVFPTDPEAKKYISREDANTAVRQCLKQHVLPVVTGRDWKRIDLLGDKPLQFIGGKTEGIFQWRGSPIEIPALPGKVITIPTLHPAYIMRDQTMFPVAVNDLCKSTEVPPEHYTPFPSLDDVANFKFTTFAFDIETKGKGSEEITLVGLCARPYFAMAVPFRGEYIGELRRIFSAATVVIGHNALQFDLPLLRNAGVRLDDKCRVYDTMLMQHLLFPDFPHDLEFVGSQFSGKSAWKADKQCFQIYNCRDVDVTFQCWQKLLPMLREQELEDVYNLISVPMAMICRLMHETGFKIDPTRIVEVREKLLAEIAEEEKFLPEQLKSYDKACFKNVPVPEGVVVLGKSGKPLKVQRVASSKRIVPWRSPDRKIEYLYGKQYLDKLSSDGDGELVLSDVDGKPESLGLDPILDPKTERITTGKIALAKIQNRLKKAGKYTEARSVAAIEKLNKLDELITTFAKEGMQSIGRMHPHFNVHGTASGRLSSSEPNLQNIPESARFLYVPSHPGWKIVDVDYSQIENRLTAYFAGDAKRAERFIADPKFSEHKFAASLFLGIDYKDVVKDNDKDAPYGKAKRIVHGTNYGMGYKKISNMYDMELGETKRLQDTWKRAIWPTIQWQTRIGEQAKKDGVLTTPFGRKRWFWTSSYFTESLSFLPQSTAADCIFRAMIGLMYQRIGWPEELVRKVVRVYEPVPEPCRLLIQVHDSLGWECPAEMVDTLVAIVKRVMCQPWEELGGLHIPIGVKVGDDWGSAEDYKL